VPPYIVFGDATLIQMARDKPLDERQLLAVSGVGQSKLDKYGQAFLDAIADYCMSSRDRAVDLDPALHATWLAYQEGLDLDAIATRRGLRLPEAADQLLGLLRAGQPVAPERLLAPRKVEMIEQVLEQLGDAVEWQALRSALPPLVADHEIRLMQAAW
jgi:ATP-dependent DNA helicase RecQ